MTHGLVPSPPSLTLRICDPEIPWHLIHVWTQRVTVTSWAWAFRSRKPPSQHICRRNSTCVFSCTEYSCHEDRITQKKNPFRNTKEGAQEVRSLALVSFGGLRVLPPPRGACARPRGASPPQRLTWRFVDNVGDKNTAVNDIKPGCSREVRGVK